MTSINLLEPLLADAIRTPSFFNGRVLSAEDLAQAADASRQWTRLIGQATGTGVACGLEVRPSPITQLGPAVRVSSGLAVNRRGAPLPLPSDVDVLLTRPPSNVTVGGGFQFADCEPPTSTPFTPAAGVYLLTIGPARAANGLAPINSLGNGAAPCNTRETLHAVQFRLLQVDVPGADPASGRFRNQVAVAFFGLEALLGLKGFASGGDIAGYGRLDDLLAGKALTACEVPLATIHWTAAGIQYVDLWSVRRRLTRAGVEPRWPQVVGDRRLAEAEAFFLAFEDHLLALATPPHDVSTTAAADHFAYLPPAGILPVGTFGFSPPAFFRGFTLQTVEGDHALLRGLLHESFYEEPFRVDDATVIIRVLTFPDHPEYVLYARARRPPVDQTPTPEPSALPGGFDIRITAAEGVRLSQIAAVWAEDKAGKRYDARPWISFAMGFATGLFELEPTTRYLVDGLPPGPYLVKVSATGAPTASVSAAAVTQANVLVNVRLRPYLGPCKRQFRAKREVPRIDVVTAEPLAPFTDATGFKYNKLVVMHDYRTAATAVPKKFVAAPSMQLSDPLARQLLTDWDCWLDYDVLTQVVTDKPPKIVIDPDYIPGKFPPPGDPYAYAVIDDLAYPLILTAADKTLPTSLPATAAGIPELTPEVYATTLAPAGLGDLDIFAAAWGGLYADVLGLRPEAIGQVAADLDAGVTTAIQEKRYYPGMTPQVAGQLKAKGWDDVRIANATPTEITAQFGADAGKLAQRWIGQARAIVPEAAWSLRSGASGLDAAAIAGLEASGIDTVAALAKPENAATIAAVAGVSEVEAKTIQDAASTSVAAIGAALQPEPSLVSLGLTTDQAKVLVAQQLDSAVKIAADAQTVASVLKVEGQAAAPIIASATNATTTAWAGVAKADVGHVQQALTRVGSVADVAPITRFIVRDR